MFRKREYFIPFTQFLSAHSFAILTSGLCHNFFNFPLENFSKFPPHGDQAFDMNFRGSVDAREIWC
jgi:hypothetical protein